MASNVKMDDDPAAGLNPGDKLYIRHLMRLQQEFAYKVLQLTTERPRGYYSPELLAAMVTHVNETLEIIVTDAVSPWHDGVPDDAMPVLLITDSATHAEARALRKVQGQ